MGLPLHDKPDSAEICFVPGNDYRAFLAERLPQRPGDIVESAGAVVGEHDGVAGFTIGQRKGIGAFGGKRFVTGIDPELNLITIGDETTCSARPVGGESQLGEGGPPAGRVRGAGQGALQEPAAGPHRARPDDEIEVEFSEPLRAITPGQAAVIYDGDRVIGGGIIARPASSRPAEAAAILRKRRPDLA